MLALLDGSVLLKSLLELVELPSHFARFLLFGLHFANFANGAFHLCVALRHDGARFFSRLVDDGAVLGGDALETCLIVGHDGIEAFLLGADVAALVLPIATVAHDVEQVFVHVHIVATHDFGGLVDDGNGQPDFARYLDGE